MSIWARLRFAALVATDRLLGTHLVDREMAHLQQHMEAFAGGVSTLRQQMRDLNLLLHAVQVQMCVLYLHQRHILRPATWLCFTPDESEDEEKSLDLLVNRLVRHNLATIRTEVVGERAYAYHLRPDWDAIVDLLGSWQEFDNPVISAWLDEIRSNNNG